MIGTLAITISPPLKGAPQNVYFEQRFVVERLIKRACSYYAIYPELDGARLHWHGTITVKDPRKWFMQTLPTIIKQIGFVKCKPLKTVTDKITWNVYCLKNFAFFRWIMFDHIQETNSFKIQIIPRRIPHRAQPKLPTNTIMTLLDYGITIN